MLANAPGGREAIVQGGFAVELADSGRDSFVVLVQVEGRCRRRRQENGSD
jgi:hypothetical protein